MVLTVNKATVNAKLAPVPDIFKVWTVFEVPTVCWTKKTNFPSVIDWGFVTVKLLPVAVVKTISLTF